MVSKFWPKIIKRSQHKEIPPPSLSIQLLESILYTHPGHNPVLRGTVDIRCQQPIVVSSLQLDFQGSLDYRLSKRDIICQKELAQSSLSLYPPPSSSQPLIIHTSNTFTFEMPLPNKNRQSLIQSIRCNEFHVKYQIRAILEYQQHEADNKKLIIILKSRPQAVTIIQIPSFDESSTFFTSDNMLASIDSRKQSNHWCQYRVQVDKRFAAISSMLSLSIRVAPLIQGLKLNQASMHLVQRFTMTTQTYSRPATPLECQYQSTPYPSAISTGGTLYEGNFHYKIPPTMVPSIKTANIKVEHDLVVHLTLTYPQVSHDGILRRARRVLTFESEFDLLHPLMANADEVLALPAYDTPANHQLVREFFPSCQPPIYEQTATILS